MSDYERERLAKIQHSIEWRQRDFPLSDVEFLMSIIKQPGLPVEKEEFGVRFAPDPYVHGRTSSRELAQKLGEAFQEGPFEIVKRPVIGWTKA